MTSITPIGSQRRKLIIADTQKYIRQAEDIFSHPFDSVNVLFNLKAQASGMFLACREHRLIRYNPYIFAKHFDYCVSNTVPHEVAHYVMYCLYGPKGTRPHGREWKDLMRKFGAIPSRTNSLDLTGIPIRRHRRHPYTCSCMNHQISSRRHNRIRAGKARYFCRSCKGELVSTPVLSSS
jgi:SprT protein